jgi:hypothetical protein
LVSPPPEWQNVVVSPSLHSDAACMEELKVTVTAERDTWVVPE